MSCSLLPNSCLALPTFPCRNISAALQSRGHAAWTAEHQEMGGGELKRRKSRFGAGFMGLASFRPRAQIAEGNYMGKTITVPGWKRRRGHHSRASNAQLLAELIWHQPCYRGRHVDLTVEEVH